MDLIPNGINLFLWLRSDCLVSTTQITLESVIHIRFRFWLLVCCFYNLWSNADFSFFGCNLRQKRNAIVSETSGTLDVTLGWSSAGLCSDRKRKEKHTRRWKFVDMMKFLDAAPLNSFTLRSGSFRLRLLTKHSSALKQQLLLHKEQ